jgi:hypothetical protein
LRSRVEACRLEPARPHAPNLLRADDPAFFEHAKMLHHRRQRHIERLSQRTDGARPGGEPLDDGTTRRLRERMKRPVNARIV